jgi:uncharacterized membrane protein
MFVLILGIAVFLGIHTLTTLRDTRERIVGRLGISQFKMLYSIGAAVGLALIIWGFSIYRAEGLIQLWTPPTWMRHLTMPLVWLAFIALASRRSPPGRIRGWLRHPMLVAVKFWALGHLLANGDLGGLILFGSFLGWAVYDRIAVKRRGDAGAPRLDAFTRGDAIALGAGTLAYGVMFALHPWLIGAPILRG